MTIAEKTKAEAGSEVETETEASTKAKTKAAKKVKPKTEKTVKEEPNKAAAGKEKEKTTKQEKPFEEKKEEKSKTTAVEKHFPEKKEKVSSVKFSIKVPAASFEEEFNEALLKYASEVKLPGFRQGKVPVEVIKSRYKEAVQEEVVNKVVEKAVFEKIEADKLKIISRPEVKNIQHKEGKDITADIEVELFPTIEIPYLETVEVKVPSAELTVEDYDEKKQIDLVLEAHRRQTPAHRAIKEGDSVMLKTQAKILQTKRMTPRKNIQYRVDEKESVEILDLAKELIDKNINDSFTIKRRYPEDYQKKPWAGKVIEHYITVESIFEWVKPELNKDFLKTIGVEDEESFKKKLKEEYEKVNNQQLEDKKMKYIIDTLCETIDFPLPRGMVEHEVSRMASQRQQHYPMDFKDEKQVKEYMDSLKIEAERTLRFSFITEAIKEKFNLEVSSDDLENHYKNIAEQNHLPIKEVRKFYMNKENAEKMKDKLLQDKVMDLIKGKVKIKEV